MGGGEAVTTATIDQQVYFRRGLVNFTGPQPFYVFFDQMAACCIGQAYCYRKGDQYINALPLKIDQQEGNDKHVQRKPGEFIPEYGHQQIKKRVGPTGVDKVENLLVEVE